MSFLIHPSNPGDSIQETDKDTNNIKIANLANPTDNEDATNKKYVNEKTETIERSTERSLCFCCLESKQMVLESSK